MRLSPILKVLVIGDYCELWETFEVVALIFESSNNRHELLVVDFVITLRCVHCLRSVRDRVPQAVVALLGEYPAGGKVGCVYLNFSRVVRIVKCQNRCFCECLLECSECCFLIFFLVPGCVLLHGVIERTCFSQEVLDESLVEVGKAEEFPNISKVVGLRPVSDRSGFSVIHAYTTGFNDHAEVLNMVTVELALLRLQVQVVFFEMSQDFVCCLSVGCLIGTVDQDIIYVDGHLPFRY